MTRPLSLLIALVLTLSAAAQPPTAIADIPWASPDEIALSPFGVAVEGGTGLRDIRGTGATVPTDGSLFDQRISHCYIGARLVSSDTEISRCRLFNNRDVCLWISRDAGNCQSTNVHCYGARIAIYNEGGAWYRSNHDTAADAYLGALCDAESKFIGTFFQHNLIRDCVLRGGNCELHACTVNVQREAKEANSFNVPGLPAYSGKAGIQLDGGDGRVLDCLIVLTNWIHPAHTRSGNAASAVIVNAPNCTIRSKLFETDGVDGSRGIVVTANADNLVVDCEVVGFQEPGDRILVVQDAANTKGLDITLNIKGAVKPVGDYIDIGAGWTGTIRLIDTATGRVFKLPEGKAA